MTSRLTFKQTITLQPAHSAKSMGSGHLEVLSTPALCALMENTAIQAIAPDLSPDEDTVGVEISIEHLKATKIGEDIHCTATIIAREGRSIYFNIEVKNAQQDLIGRAKHTRVVIDPKRFMENF